MVNNKEENDNLHVYFHYPSFMPSEIIDKLADDFSSEDIKPKIIRIETGPYAAMEWAVPTFIVAYITKPFFESFFSEAGKDSYNIFKSWAKGILSKGNLFRTKRIVATQSTQKITQSYTQSQSVSIVIQLKDKNNITLLFDENLSLEEWANGVDEFLDFLKLNYDDFKIVSESNNGIPIWRNSKVYGLINVQTKKWEFYTNEQMIQNHIDKSRAIQ